MRELGKDSARRKFSDACRQLAFHVARIASRVARAGSVDFNAALTAFPKGDGPRAARITTAFCAIAWYLRLEPQKRAVALKARSFRSSHQVVALGTLKFFDDLAALREEAPRFLSAREEERAEPELVAQAPRADQIPIREQTPERE